MCKVVVVVIAVEIRLGATVKHASAALALACLTLASSVRAQADIPIERCVIDVVPRRDGDWSFELAHVYRPPAGEVLDWGSKLVGSQPPRHPRAHDASGEAVRIWEFRQDDRELGVEWDVPPPGEDGRQRVTVGFELPAPLREVDSTGARLPWLPRFGAPVHELVVRVHLDSRVRAEGFSCEPEREGVVCSRTYDGAAQQAEWVPLPWPPRPGRTIRTYARPTLGVEVGERARLELTYSWEGSAPSDDIEVILGTSHGAPTVRDERGTPIEHEEPVPQRVVVSPPTRMTADGSERAVIRWSAPLRPDGYGWMARRVRFPAPTLVHPDDEARLELRSARPIAGLDCEREGDAFRCRGAPTAPLRVWVDRPESTATRELAGLGALAILLFGLAGWRIRRRYLTLLRDEGERRPPARKPVDEPASYRAAAPIEAHDSPAPRLPREAVAALWVRSAAAFGPAVALTAVAGCVLIGRSAVPLAYPVGAVALFNGGLGALLFHRASRPSHWSAWLVSAVGPAGVLWLGSLTGLLLTPAAAYSTFLFVGLARVGPRSGSGMDGGPPGF